MRRKPSAARAALAALLLGWGAVAAACGPYEVTLYEYGSLYYRNAQGRHVGIDPEVLEEISRRSGCRFSTRLDSRVRTWAALADGRLDMTVSALPTPERARYVHFIGYFVTRNHLLLKESLARRVGSLADFEADPRLRLGVVRGFKHGPLLDAWIERLRAQGRVSESPDAEVLARVFAAGRVDAFLSHPLTWGPLLRRNRLEGTVRMLDVAPSDQAVGSLALSRSRVREEDVARVRDAVAAMRADGSLEAILARHLDPKLAREVVREVTREVAREAARLP